MSQKLRILVSAAPTGPWSALAGRIEAAGAEIRHLAADATDIPAEWTPDAFVTLPVPHATARFDQLDLDAWEAAADAELNTRFRLGQIVARRMNEGAGGAIIHIAAADGLPGAAEAGTSAILSYASAGLSRGIALDLKPGIRSNTLALTPDAASLDAAAAMIVFLAGEQGAGMTGQIAAITPTDLQLFAQSRPLRVAHSDGGWDEASLAAQIARWRPYLPRLAENGEAL
ncbi:MAG: hypothetical protein ABS76_10275 [Pelagibacterium sp. SCN 64-44]|nr:MAG: hypothetical protein ABS76_10275 [Pelagibacterium sp. SCN 64-44]